MLTLSATAALLSGRHLGRDAEYTHVGSDSRATIPGMLFVALKGERFDGHDFVHEVLARGAAGALVTEEWARCHPDLPLVAVADPRRSLGKLAAHWRSRFSLPLIGITGSNGKTTVKEMCAAILRAHFGQNAVHATSGNLNNDIGVPLTLLKLRHNHHAAVIEMGMNHPGEIIYLTHIARPSVAVVTNAQRAHLAGLGSLTEVARAKGEIFAGLNADGIAIINADDPHADLWRELNGQRRIIRFGMSAAAEVKGRWQPAPAQDGFGSRLELVTPLGSVSLTLQLAGVHNARNALAAAAACLAAGVPLIPIQRGLEGFRGVTGRLTRIRGRCGASVIDDTYNANPDSMRAAIDVLAAWPGRRIFVMGDMGELGTAAAQLHEEIGAYAKNKGIEHLFALGEQSLAAVDRFDGGGRHFTSIEALTAALLPLMDKDSCVLVKGSRFMRMERVVAAIVEAEDAA